MLFYTGVTEATHPPHGLFLDFIPEVRLCRNYTENVTLLLISLSAPLLFLQTWVDSDSATEINTLSHAELPYQSHPSGRPVDMDTVNIVYDVASGAKGAARREQP